MSWTFHDVGRIGFCKTLSVCALPFRLPMISIAFDVCFKHYSYLDMCQSAEVVTLPETTAAGSSSTTNPGMSRNVAKTTKARKERTLQRTCDLLSCS